MLNSYDRIQSRPILVLILVLLSALLGGCSQPPFEVTPSTTEAPPTEAPPSQQASDKKEDPPTPTPTPAPTPTPTDPAKAACEKWKSISTPKIPIWKGDIATCNAGTLDNQSRNEILELVNYYRSLVGMNPVKSETTKDLEAQECSLMMDANKKLDHYPSSSWLCYSDKGSRSAGQSNLYSSHGWQAIGVYMLDPGNSTTFGHRRWILSNSLGPGIGIGSTSGASCLQVVGQYGVGAGPNRSWTAWPPPGEAIPLAAAQVDSTGWTLQSDSINLGSAQVKVSDAGQTLPIKITQLLANYGSTYALSFTPIGWNSQPGHSYSVDVTGVSKPFSYTVKFIDCK